MSRSFVPSLSRRSLVAAGALLLAAGGAAAQGSAKPNKLVVQVSDADPGKWGLALNNTYNVMADLGAETTEVEIVVYGPGIGMLKAGSAVGDRIANAMKNGVKVVACENTMNGQHLTKADMLPNISYVQAGVVELMKKQQQGWAYLRP
jgi:intracellular sulfur oxidation DsrE/DsrF family protein